MDEKPAGPVSSLSLPVGAALPGAPLPRPATAGVSERGAPGEWQCTTPSFDGFRSRSTGYCHSAGSEVLGKNDVPGSSLDVGSGVGGRIHLAPPPNAS